MRSVKAKLAVLVATAVVSSVLLVTLASAWNDANRRFSAKRAELLGVASAIATAVAHPLASNDISNVTRTLSAIGRIPGLTFARVTDGNGKPIHQFGFGVVVARETGAVEANPVIGPFSVFYLATYPVVVPIISSGQPIGQLTLIADLSYLRGAFFDSLLSGLLAGIAAGAVGLLVSGRLQRGISEPVAQLTSAMDDVSRTKDFTRQVQKTSDDEIGRLVESFNGMLSEVQARDAELAAHRDHLESQVQERTAELLDAKLTAEAASAAKSEFLATMSHEIRTPMNGMLVMAEMIATGALTPRLQRYADVLLSSGQTLLAIINDILDFSKIEAGKLELERVPVDVRRIVDDTLKLFNERAVSKNLELAAAIAPGVPLTIAADPVRLTQVLSNLVNNALKFTESGSIVVRAAMCDSGVQSVRQLEIHVSDTGIGIPAEKLATIFEAFSQADQSTTRRFGGTGIGLTICRRLVTAMGGQIEVVSESGCGSTFTVRIPVEVLAEYPARLQVAAGGSNTIAITAASTVTHDILAGYAAQRGLNAIVFEASAFAKGAGCGVRAVIATPADIEDHAGAVAAWRGRIHNPIVVLLSNLGDTRAAKLLASGIADIVLEKPLASAELEAFFDGIVAGHVLSTGPEVSASQANGQHQQDQARFARLRVLAADDNAVNREVLSEALGRLGVSVTCVENGALAVQAVRDADYDLVFMDCSMPVMDGFEATRRIRDFEHLKGHAPVPVIALTAYVVGEAANAWRDAGMSGYLTKPYTLKALRECLERSVSPSLREDIKPLAGTDAPAAGTCDPADVSASALLDPLVLESIEEMQSPGDNLVERIVQLYATHAPKSLEALLTLEPGGDHSAIAAAAHALRSLSRNIGANRVADLCTRIETDAHSGDLNNLNAYCTALQKVLPETLATLARETAAQPGAERGAEAVDRQSA